jgi:hypothetical protein
VVQDFLIRPHVVNFRCERWQTADGAMMTAPLPWGSIKAHGFLPDTVIVSDDAGQFNVGQHGLAIT